MCATAARKLFTQAAETHPFACDVPMQQLRKATACGCLLQRRPICSLNDRGCPFLRRWLIIHKTINSNPPRTGFVAPYTLASYMHRPSPLSTAPDSISLKPFRLPTSALARASHASTQGGTAFAEVAARLQISVASMRFIICCFLVVMVR